MPIDLKKLSDDDLLALEQGDLTKLSDSALLDLEKAQQEEQQAAAKFPTPTATTRFDIPGAQFQPPAETLQKGAITALRYAPAIAVGAATGGAGFIPAMAATGLTAGASEFAAQGAEQLLGMREAPSYREVAAQTVAGMAVPAPLRPAAEGAMLTTGAVVKNFLANYGLSLGSGEVSRAITAGEAAPGKEEQVMRFEAPTTLKEVGLRAGLPALVSAIGTGAQAKSIKSQQAFATREQLAAERSGGSVMLSEILPDFTDIEAKAYQSGNQFARTAAANMDTNLGAVINEAYKDAPRSDQIRNRMMAYAAPLEDMRQSAVAARENAKALEERVATARVVNTEQQQKFIDESRKASVEALKQQALYMDGLDRLFPMGMGDIASVAPGARIDFIKSAAETAKGAVSSGMFEIFQRVGIGLDEGVTRLKDVYNQLPHRQFARVDLEEIKASLEKALQKPGMLTKEGDITLAGYRRIRDDIASDLVQAGKDAKYANRVAGSAYDAVRAAAEKYLGRADPTLRKRFKEANRIASEVYATRASETGVIDDLAAGNIGSVVAKIEKEGVGPVLKDISAYADAIKGFGDEGARAAAQRFKADVALAIRDNLVETSMLYGKGLDATSQIIDVPSLVKRLDTLRSKGLSPETLGFGTTKDVQALARIADTNGGTLNPEKINSFINDVGEVGRDAAVARANYQRAYVDYLTSTKAADKQIALAKLEIEGTKASMDAATKDRIYQAAAKDPMVQLLNDNTLNLSPRLGDNAKYVDRVLASGPDGVRRLTTALETPSVLVGDAVRNAKLLDDLRKSATASVFMDKFQEALGPGDHRLQLEQITDFFYGNSQKKQRDAFVELVGRDTFNTLEKTYAAPISKILAKQKAIGAQIGSIRSDLIPLFGAIGTLKGKSTRGVIAGNQAVDSLNYFQKKQYNLAYLLYLDPETSAAYRKAMYNISAFVNANPRNAIAYQIAVSKDQQANSTQDQPNR